MPKRSQPDSQRSDLPAPKKPRYNYDVRSQLIQPRSLPRMTTNSDEETVSEIETPQNTAPNRITKRVALRSTTRAIESNSNSAITSRRIPNCASIKSAEDWCPIRWFRNRVYHQDADDLFAILPHEETNGVAKELLMHVGASTTLITNTIENLNTMNAITKYIQNEHEKEKNKEQNHYHSSNKSRQLSNKQKKRWIREQNEILSTCNARVLDESKEKYIGKIRDDVDRYHSNDKKYKAYEKERKSIWKSIPNGNAHPVTPTPPPTNSNYDNFLSQTHQHHQHHKQVLSHKSGECLYEDDSEFMSSEDHESDEDFSLHTDDGSDCYSSRKRKKSKRKKRKKKKKKKKQHRRKLEQERVHDEMETPIDSLYNEGKNPVYADTQPQRFWAKFRGYFEPTDAEMLRALIPELQGDAYPVKIPSLPNEKYDDLSCFDDTIMDAAASDDGKENHNHNDLYFAEMPKNYEYFAEDESYIDEEHRIESIHNTQQLRQSAIHQEYPNKSLMGHSFDQRTLSCFVHECDGMYDIEHEVDGNDWRKIGKKKSGAKKEEEEEMIEPVIRYKALDVIADTFESALRQQIGKYFFAKPDELEKIVSMPWHQRLDDECCATIKSLEGTLESVCYETAPNHVDVNIKIAMEIMQIVQNEDAQRNYDSYQELIRHVQEIEKNHIASNGEFVVDHQTLSEPEWAHYFKHKENLAIDKAVKAYTPSLHVQTVQQMK